jgi:hypothetical protein
VPGGWLGDTLALYGRVFQRGAVLAVRNWQVGLAVIVYTALVSVAAVVAAQLGFAGGLLLGLVMTACASSWLSLTAQVLQTGRAGLRDLPAGFGTYLGDLLTVGFLLMGLRLIASIVLAPFPLLNIVFGLATLAFFNAVPELIYLGRHAPAELLVASYRFVGENWIEWFPANMLLAAGVGLALLVPAGPYGLVSALAVGVLLAYAMIVRGLLFQELASSGRRAREFKRRAEG